VRRRTTVFGGLVEAEFPLAPSVSANWYGRYEFALGGGSLGLQIDGVWNDDQFLEGTNSQVSHEGSYAVWNARVDYTSGAASGTSRCGRRTSRTRPIASTTSI
jgi:hypothetical protein